MKGLRGKMMLGLSLLMVSALIILTGASLMRIRQTEQGEIAAKARQIQQAYESILREAVVSAQMGAVTLASFPPSVEAFAARDRDKLKQVTMPIFQAVKPKEVSQVQFHLAPATSFLRLHQPDKFGDDLTAIRATVVKANESKQTVVGLEEGKAGWGIRAVVPISFEGKHIGTVEYGSDFGDGFLKRLQAIAPGQYFLYRFPEGSVAWDEAGRTQLRLAGTEKEDGLATSTALIEQVKGSPSAVWERQGSNLMVLVPVRDYSGQTKGFLKMAGPLTLTGQNSDTFSIVVVVLLALLILVVTYWLLQKSLSPLARISLALRQVASGDLTVPELPVTARDETGAIARDFNAMVENLRTLTRQVTDSVQTVAASAAQLTRSTGQVAQVTAGVSSAVGQVAQGATSQVRSVQQASETITELRNAIMQIATGAQEQARSAQDTSTMIGDMAAAIDCVVARAAQVSSSAQQAQVAAQSGGEAASMVALGMSQIRTNVMESAEQIKALGELSTQIGVITQVITEIAGQTNLLALNAAIEAARAGEHGRGFSVVAEEVRKLAERANTSTKEIAELIQRIQAGTSRAVEATAQGTAAVEEGSRLSASAGQSLHDIQAVVAAAARDAQAIVSAAESVGALSQQVMDAIGSVTAVIEENTAATEEMAAGAEQVMTLVQEIAAISAENATSAEKVAAAEHEVNASTEQIATETGRLEQVARELQSRTSHFRV